MPRKAVDSEVRLRSLNLKTTEDLRKKVEDAARVSGRALTYEVEHRLELSFQQEQDSLALRILKERLSEIWRLFDRQFGTGWAEHEVGIAAMKYGLMRCINITLHEETEPDPAMLADAKSAMDLFVNAVLGIGAVQTNALASAGPPNLALLHQFWAKSDAGRRALEMRGDAVPASGDA